MDTTLLAICNSQFLLIVQPLEHVALIHRRHASQCVLINFWKACDTHTHTHTHTNTHLITVKAGGHIPDEEAHTYRKRKKVFYYSLHDNTLNQGHCVGDSGSWT